MLCEDIESYKEQDLEEHGANIAKGWERCGID